MYLYYSHGDVRVNFSHSLETLVATLDVPMSSGVGSVVYVEELDEVGIFDEVPMFRDHVADDNSAHGL